MGYNKAMHQHDRALFDRALRRAHMSAYGLGEFVDQESFLRAREILELATRAGIGPGVSVLDLCCGMGGAGRLVTRHTGCTYLGVDLSASAIGIARARAGELGCRFEVAQVPPLPSGRFDVVMLLETLLAFPDKEPLLRGVHDALVAGGRFVCTVEEGQPLTADERARMPGANTVWLTPLEDLLAVLDRVGLVVRWQAECTRAHRAVVDALLEAFTGDAADIAAQIGRDALDELVAAHRLWSDWLGSGRARKFAIVTERVPVAAQNGAASPVGGQPRRPERR